MIFGLPDTAIQKLKEVFNQESRIENVWLYGSRALGREKPASDIDLCIEAEALKLRDLHMIERKIDDLNLPWKVDLSLKHQIDNPALVAHIEQSGINFLNRTIY